jgi:5-methylcytosine-specific restriction protein A
MPNKPARYQPQRHQQRTTDGRPASHDYGRHWRKLRLCILVERPTCEASGCNRAATQVDHVVAIKDGGTNDDDNLMPLCASCHSKKGCREDGLLGLPRRPPPRPA